MPRKPAGGTENWVRESSNTKRARRAKGLSQGFNPKKERLVRVEGMIPLTYKVVPREDVI